MAVYRSANEALDCLVYNEAGVPYEELSCLYPIIKPFFSKWEIDYNPVAARDYMVDNPWIPIVVIMLYGGLIIWGQNTMKSRKPWNWRRLMALWNLSLSLFSWCGLIRSLPNLVHLLLTYPLSDILCFDPESSFGSGSSGLWVQLFVLSKFPELLDTFFIVIHKKPLMFLHWYHHVTVLLYCWHAYTTSAPSGLFFTTMNYGVHAIMYMYYFLMATKLKPKWFKSIYITVAQISQMVVGLIITILGFYYYGTTVKGANGEYRMCMIKKDNNIAASIMYGSYLALFCQFFCQKYLQFKAKAKTKTKKL